MIKLQKICSTKEPELINNLLNTDTVPYLEVTLVLLLYTIHLYCPLSSIVILVITNVLLFTPVAFDGIVLFPILIHWYFRLSAPLALHVRVIFVPTAAIVSLG